MKPCLLTFDVEDWFQVENLRLLFPPTGWDGIPRRVADSTGKILNLLEEYNIKSTFFVLGWIAEREPGLLVKIARAGHEVACHGYGHILPLQLTPDQFRDDLARARCAIRDACGQEVVGYRAPSFSMDRERLEILAECGFQYDSSHHPFRVHSRYGRIDGLGSPILPSVYQLPGGLIELGLPVEKIGPIRLPASGGAYFRLYPGPLFRRLASRSLRRLGHHIMYLHSWEVDPDQPRARGAGLTKTFRHYHGISRTLTRLRRLIEMFRKMDVPFLTARDFVNKIDIS
jgi:polysaccharide deacetylase family protein (PEP-CTERM system associated)